MLGVELNDRLVSVARDGDSVATASATMVRGMPALATTVAQLAPPAGDAALWATFAPPLDGALPGEWLQQLRAAGYAVQGFADRAALLAAWLPEVTSLAVLALTRRQFSISLATRDAEADAASLRRHVPLPGGQQAVHDAWLRLAAATLVQQTRFDPTHDVRHESALRAQLAALAQGAQRSGQAQIEVSTGTSTVPLALTRDQFAAAVTPVLAPLASALQALSAAHGDALLLVDDSVLAIPGIDAALSGARFARLCRGADDLAARAASLLAPSGVSAAGGVPYRTRLPLLARPAPESVLQPLSFSDQAAQAMATHIVYGGKVIPITAAGIVLGRDPGDAATLRLPEGVAGLSRRHCTLRREGARTQVIDHSSHGTFVDGGRVRGRALLPAGATLRLGDPGIELPLVAIDS